MRKTSKWRRAWRVKMIKLKKKIFKGKKGSKAKLIRNLSLVGLVGVVGSFFLALIMFAWFARDLPRPDKIVRREGFATKIYDREGELLYDVFADQRRTPIELSETPEYLRQATVAIEDKHFYQHQGFDPQGLARAVYKIIFERKLQGGSTLTQQLVKNVLLTPERTIRRKIREFIMAVQIEKRYSKEQILQMYLNEAPYGGTAWGVQAASESYFGKDVSDLNLVESAFLAGLPQAPSRYSPYGSNPEAYQGRTTAVLRRMREDGYITPAQEKQALEQLEQMKFETPGGKFKAPHFVMYVKSVLEERYGERMVEQGGLKVYTTLDWDVHQKAQEIVTEEIAKVEETLHITNGALMVLDPQTGEILSMVGSKDYSAKDYDGQVNVTTRLRQPGSSIKPLTYATAFRKGYTASTMVVDARTEFLGGAGQPPYVPENYTGEQHGPVQLRYALGSSLNIPAVKVLSLVGLKDALQLGYDMGFTTLEPTKANLSRFGLAFTLGGGEIRLIDMVSAYSTFANEGHKVEPTAVLKVEDSTGKVLEENKPEKGQSVISQEVAYLVSDILADDSARWLTFGRNSLLNIPGHRVAVKTGTTNDLRDNWTVGWTPDFIVGVWVGNNDNSKMKQVASGVSGASPIWRRVVLEILKQRPATDFKTPDGIVSLKVDRISGYPEHDGWDARDEIFVKGTEPVGPDPIHTKLKLCKGQDKLATDAQVLQGDYEEKEFIILKSDNPKWQEGIDAWIGGQEDERYRYPKDYCDAETSLAISWHSPDDRAQVGNDFQAEVKIASSNDVDRVEIYANDEKKATLRERPYRTNLVLPDGTYELKAKVWDSEGNSAETARSIGVNVPWDYSPSPTPTPTPEASQPGGQATLTPTPIPTITSEPSETPAATPTP